MVKECKEKMIHKGKKAEAKKQGEQVNHENGLNQNQ